MGKITRKGATHHIRQTPKGEWQVMLGNKVLSRHSDQAAAHAAYDAIKAA